MVLVLGTNSYATVAEADAYFADNLRNPEWTALTTKDEALITASKSISISVIDSAKLPIDLPIDAILKCATFELALDMALDPDVVLNPGEVATNLKEVGAGPGIGAKFFRRTRGTSHSDRILRILASGGFVSALSSPLGTSIASGLDGDSSFTCPSNKTRGFL